VAAREDFVIARDGLQPEPVFQVAQHQAGAFRLGTVEQHETRRGVERLVVVVKQIRGAIGVGGDLKHLQPRLRHRAEQFGGGQKLVHQDSFRAWRST
jgi:hypothetical protein